MRKILTLCASAIAALSAAALVAPAAGADNSNETGVLLCRMGSEHYVKAQVESTNHVKSAVVDLPGPNDCRPAVGPKGERVTFRKDQTVTIHQYRQKDAIQGQDARCELSKAVPLSGDEKDGVVCRLDH
ncbi:MAG: hypothetical protein J2P18_16315 [Nocardia sp.]|nr:hypothetical protein [Nocardia sp.]